MYTIKSSNISMLEIYNLISSRDTSASRFKRGSCANLQEAGDNWLIKSDKIGFELVEHEFEVLLELQEFGLVPQVDEDEGVFGYPASFYIRKINNAATIGDYCEAFLGGDIPLDVFKGLISSIGILLSDFWDLGWVHGDLNPNNIVVGMEKGGKTWRPYLIDTAFSFKEEDGNSSIDKSSIGTIEEDKEYFLECLRQLDQTGDTDYERALNILV